MRRARGRAADEDPGDVTWDGVVGTGNPVGGSTIDIGGGKQDGGRAATETGKRASAATTAVPTAAAGNRGRGD